MSVLEWSTGPRKDTLVDQNVSQNLSEALTAPDRLFWVDRCVGQTIQEDQAPLFLLSLWFISKDRGGNGHRERKEEVLFIDARKLGMLQSRRLRVLTDENIARISDTYHAWRNHHGDYQDIPGFAKSATIDEIEKHDFVLTPGRYVGTAEAETDDEPFDEKIGRLTSELFAEFDRGRELENEVRRRLSGLSAL